MKNKKGAEMTIGTIIVIILALVVLVVIIYGFTTGWGNLWQKITGLSGGKANVATQVQSCQLACTSQSKSDYCKSRDVIFTDKGKAQSYTCERLQIERGSSIGLDECSTISCQGVTEEGTCAGNRGKWVKDPCSSKEEDITTRLINTNDKGDFVYCCRSTCIRTFSGNWKDTACDPAKEVDKALELSDKMSDNPNNLAHCCVLKTA